jgi:hypothetical protein
MLKPAALMIIALAAPALAEDTAVPLPRERPSLSAGPVVPLPKPRPTPQATQPPAPAPAPATNPPPTTTTPIPAAPPSSTEPTSIEVTPPAPPRDYQAACPAVMSGIAIAKTLPPIHEGQCGLQTPLSLSAVTANGRTIELNAPVTTDCGMATALPAWIGEVDSYITAKEKTRIKTINLGTNYACRNVDNAKTGNLSFHAFADALDVIGFTLEDGRTISIAPGFNGTPEQGHDILHFARDAACTHFMTVLSPDADSYHQDNMHIDLGCHGKQCTSRLCQ